ncbi:MAG: hypothetical protein RLZZ299_2861 [Pseudomonadota bacterium]|jgi:preprotein translocase subunit SecF
MFEIIPHGFWVDFVSKRRIFAIASAVGVVLGLGLFFGVGPNWGLDFSGGTEVQVRFGASTSIADVRGALGTMGIGDDSIQQLGAPSDNRFLVRLRGESTGNTGSTRVDDARKALEGSFGTSWLESFALDSEVGTTVRVTYAGEGVPLEKVEAALARVEGVKVTAGTEPNTLRLRLPGVAEDIRATLLSRLPGKSADIERADSVGPKVGGNLRRAGIVAVVLSIVIHVIYIALRFDLTFAPGAIVGLLHDVAITCGLLVLTRQEFGLQTVSALLTLTGYSLNDTIIIYDRIRENMGKFRRTKFGELVNTSVNETLGRTLMTSISTGLAMIPFLFIGGPVLREFAFVMLVGIVVGTYSSVYVAAPITMVLDENRDRIASWFGFGGRPSSKRGAKAESSSPETP